MNSPLTSDVGMRTAKATQINANAVKSFSFNISLFDV